MGPHARRRRGRWGGGDIAEDLTTAVVEVDAAGTGMAAIGVVAIGVVASGSIREDLRNELI